MKLSVTFLGAAGEVTGSKYLLKIGDRHVLVDCGLFQGRKALRDLNYADLPIEPSSIDAVVLTHAHLDHSGYLPKLVRDGFKGPVYCTTATADLMELILMDSAKIQEEDARRARKKGYQDEVPEPLYTTADVQQTLLLVTTTVFGQPVIINDLVKARFFNAGHILGAAIVELSIRGDKEIRKIVFSGDLGRDNDPILFPPQAMEEADVLFVESTYGNKVNTVTPREEIIQMMNLVFEKNGNLVIPAFAIGRTQNLLMYIRNVLYTKEIPSVRVVVDSPMAISATALYRKHKDYHRLKNVDLDDDESFLTLRKFLTVAKTKEESKQVNSYTHHTIIIASSGMMTGGRIMHHLYHRLPDPNNVIMIAGFQAEGTKGAQLQRGDKSIRIFGQDVPVRARVYTVKGLSGHADRDELLKWLCEFKHAPTYTFVVHGEAESAGAIRDTLAKKGWNARVPKYLETVELFNDI